ncbi:hypothetical protein [Brevibacillus nitrificans]|uniref:hypothetical protein n=1 Tax=Brevibacillus nitrificans TaxID=651560 RepID=UPI00286D135E|nr:hypothetical protein [Brevibacillus nitrificans]
MKRMNHQIRGIATSAEQTMHLAREMKGNTDGIEKALQSIRSFTDQTKILGGIGYNRAAIGRL